MILSPCITAFSPTASVRSHDWFRSNLFTHEDTGGRPYDDGAYPHLGAPGGPCDALDDALVQRLWLQWASRLGKSFFGQSAALCKAEMKPGPMMHANADEKTAKEVVSRTYGMMNNTRCLRKHLRPPRMRRQDRIDFQRCKMYVAWSRSVSTLADKAVEYGHGGEIDKWEHESTSKEADPLKLFLDRGKEFPTRKFVLESTPTIKGKSRIEHGRLQSTNCQYFVPCPHCGKYQTLQMDRIVWDKPDSGKSDKDLARKTARYVCAGCEQDIHDHHRAQMMRRGVWCPEGCQVKDKEAAALFDGDRQPWRGWSLASWIDGTPLRDGPDAGYQLSSLYALSLGWGDIAAEFVSSKDKPQDFRNFVNQWLAETWEIVKHNETWEDVGKRAITKTPRGVVPEGFSLLTAGIDKQESHYVYEVNAWAPGDKHHTLLYGTADTTDELIEVLTARYRHEDRGQGLIVSLALIDSGFRPKGVGEMCKQFKGPGKLAPCKGSSTPLNAPFRSSLQGNDSAMPGMQLILVDTFQSQDWAEAVIHSREGLFSLHSGQLFDHQDYIEQLLNDAPVDSLDTRNNAKLSWNRIDEGIPNDFRDTKRYSWIAKLIVTRGGQVPARIGGAQQSPRKEPAQTPKPNRFFTRPGGWIPKR